MKKSRKKSGPASSGELPEEKACENLGPASSVELPHEIIAEVFSRLPVKTLLRFKCVCTAWNSLISDPKFVLSPSGRERAIVTYSPLATIMTSYSIDERLSIRKIPCPIDDVSYETHFAFLGTYKGMVFFHANRAFWIWNPSTNSCRSFGQLDELVYRYRQSYRIMSGVCFDKVSDDYKLVLVTSRPPEIVGAGDDTVVHVASLKKGRIQKDISFPYNQSVRYKVSTGVLMRGHIHWIVCKNIGNAQLVVYFDEEINQFRELPMPEYDDGNGGSAYYFGLTVLDGCICMSRVAKSSMHFNKYHDENDVLVMAEYGVQNSWTKKFTIKGLFVPLPIRNSNLVLVSRWSRLYTYNLKRKSCSVIKGLSKPLQERSYNKRHNATTGATKRYDLRDKISQNFDSEPANFEIDSHPVMITESLASVDCMKFTTR